MARHVVSPSIRPFFYVFLIIFILLINHEFSLHSLDFTRFSSIFSYLSHHFPFLFPLFFHCHFSPSFSPLFPMDLPPPYVSATSSRLQRSQVPPSRACCVASSRPPDQARSACSMASSAEASKPRALGSYLGRGRPGTNPHGTFCLGKLGGITLW